MGWIGAIFLVIGRHLIAINKRTGPGLAFTFVGDFFCLIAGYQTSQYSWAFIAVVMAIYDIVGWFKWKREGA